MNHSLYLMKYFQYCLIKQFDKQFVPQYLYFLVLISIFDKKKIKIY